jgi:hypothetical protein
VPLSQQDCIELVREVQALLREYDPASLELVLQATEPNDDPRRYVVQLLGTVARIYSERSGGMYGPILDRINNFVRAQDGSPVRGLSVVLSPVERELYSTDEVNLAQLPDRSEFLTELKSIILEIVSETESPEGRQ